MADIRRILKIQVPLVVKLAEKDMPVREVLELAPGAVIHFDVSHDSLLELSANDRCLALGAAVKINERFGLEIRDIPSARKTISALG